MNNRYLHTLWCDDIRQEVGNKPSLMGIYSAGIVVPKPPIILPRLAVYSCLSTSVKHPFKKLSLKVVRDDGFVIATLEQDPFDHESVQNIPRDREITRIDLMIALTLNGIEIPDGCKYFQTIAETESETLKSQKLWVFVNPDLSPNT